jgi:hypothetical protein
MHRRPYGVQLWVNIAKASGMHWNRMLAAAPGCLSPSNVRKLGQKLPSAGAFATAGVDPKRTCGLTASAP